MPAFKKLPDYRSRLQNYLTGKNGLPFRFGKNDCFTFAGGAIEAVTGEDVYSQYVGKYRTGGGAARLLTENGFDTQADFYKQFGDDVHPAFAQYGDIAILDHAGGQSLGVVFGSFAVGIAEEGIIRVPLSELKGAIRCA